MATELKILYFILIIVISYLLGAIPNGLILGKIFKHIDIRDYGSHNSGGTNAGRVLGYKLGLATIVLDALKIIFPFWVMQLIASLTNVDATTASNFCYVALLVACLGHCFPIYCHFRGGKAVSTFIGCLIATNYLYAIIFSTIFAIVLIKKRYVSLASIIAALGVAIIAILMFNIDSNLGLWSSLIPSVMYPLIIALNAILLINRHQANIFRLIKGTEPKIKWLK